MATATQADLFLAILALDAYNRGYNPGMTFTGNSDDPNTQPQIGDATIVSNLADTSASFYAVAYSWEGETVISYRGTTFENNAANLGDVLNGWTISLGFSQASQAQRVGWVERSDTHHVDHFDEQNMIRAAGDGFRECSTHPTSCGVTRMKRPIGRRIRPHRRAGLRRKRSIARAGVEAA